MIVILTNMTLFEAVTMAVLLVIIKNKNKNLSDGNEKKNSEFFITNFRDIHHF